MTDAEVCGGSDGPGFYICERKRDGPASPEAARIPDSPALAALARAIRPWLAASRSSIAFERLTPEQVASLARFSPLADRKDPSP